MFLKKFNLTLLKGLDKSEDTIEKIYSRFSDTIGFMAYGLLRDHLLAWELKTFLSLNKPIKGCDVDTLGRRIFNFGRPSYEIAHSMNCKINDINSTLARGRYPEGTVCDNLKLRDLEKKT